MKRNLFAFILTLVACLIGIGNVSASETRSLICHYNGEKEGIYIYYNYQKIGSGSGTWEIPYTLDGGKTTKTLCGGFLCGSNVSVGSFKHVFGSEEVHFNKVEVDMSNEDRFSCPAFGMIDTDNINEICFSSTTSCGSNIGTDFHAAMYLNKSSDTLFNKINRYVENQVFDSITVEELKDREILDIVKIKAEEYVKLNIIDTTTYVFPEFVKNYINNIGGYINPANTAKYTEFQERIYNEVETAVNNGSMSAEEAAEIKNKISQSFTSSLGAAGIPSVTPTDAGDCVSILTPMMAEVLNNILKFVQYLGPVLVAILTIVDFIQAAMSGEQDKVKKATDKFTKRVVVAILLFFVPLLVNLIFSITGVIPPSDCF